MANFSEKTNRPKALDKAARTPAMFAILIFFCLAAAALGLCLGSVSLGMLSEDGAVLVISRLRLPRVLGAGLAGIGLACAGTLLQAVTGNSLCAPNILGINSGAGLGIVISSAFAAYIPGLSSAAAFAGAFITAVLVLFVASAAGTSLDKSTLVLSGVAVGSMAGAFMSFLLLRYPDSAADYSAFTQGGFSGLTSGRLVVPGIIIFACLAVSLVLGGRIQLLLLGDDMAASLGVNVRLLRWICVALASAMSAAVVSYAGLISFVGLAVPHISRRLLGCGIRKNLAGSALAGFALVILADLFARTAFAPSEIPAGIVTSALGAPFFIGLIICGKRRNG